MPLATACKPPSPHAMNCPKCNGTTSVLDSRRTSENFMRRRRNCSGCSHKFTTYESWHKPDRRDRSQYHAARYAAKTPEQKKIAALRRQARDEAQRTEEPVAAIYKRWNCD